MTTIPPAVNTDLDAALLALLVLARAEREEIAPIKETTGLGDRLRGCMFSALRDAVGFPETEAEQIVSAAFAANPVEVLFAANTVATKAWTVLFEALTCDA